MEKIFQTIFVYLFFLMFIVSGANKIKHYPCKIKVLQKKINVSKTVASVGMISVILLEIIGSLLILAYFSIFPFIKNNKDDQKNQKKRRVWPKMALAIVFLFMVFMFAVTAIYHPPTRKKIFNIPFLSNLTTLAGLGFISLIIYQHTLKNCDLPQICMT